MAVNQRRRHFPHIGRGPKGDTARIAASLAPPEEQDATANDNGRIVVDGGQVKLPEGLVDESEESSNIFHLEPVVIVVLLITLAFVAFIIWQISLMPTADK